MFQLGDVNLTKLLSDQKKRWEMKQKNYYSDRPSFYDHAPSLSIAKELLLASKEDLVEELIILTIAIKGRYSNNGGNPKKIKPFSLIK
ncbi:hypothetical protein BC936DRAFT_138632 [Jimgerdemannia flammicorona]|uniref:Uncharacterized protein n=1 Tax=Jimgerdemannia flammicorona TaxID=994334 RepID=A0A433DI94_9FUNG|nr:hypothetical protein BC936DRAFT_138632 [Jimgerdemannia flammicorona]